MGKNIFGYQENLVGIDKDFVLHLLSLSLFLSYSSLEEDNDGILLAIFRNFTMLLEESGLRIFWKSLAPCCIVACSFSLGIKI